MVSTESAAANELLAVRAAELYYEENKTQDEIGAILRVTRWKVGRLLAQARERGIIRIEIVHPRAAGSLSSASSAPASGSRTRSSFPLPSTRSSCRRASPKPLPTTS